MSHPVYVDAAISELSDRCSHSLLRPLAPLLVAMLSAGRLGVYRGSGLPWRVCDKE